MLFLAMRLARAWGRPLCEVLELPEWEFRFQAAFLKYQPLPDEWEQTAVVAHAAAQPHIKRSLKLSRFQLPRKTWKGKPPKPVDLEAKILAAFGAAGVKINGR